MRQTFSDIAIGVSATLHARPDCYTLDDVEFIGMMSKSLQLMVACKDAPSTDYDSFMSYARTACIGGHIDAMIASPAEVLTQSKAGNMIPLFIMEEKLIDLFPDSSAVEKGIDFTWSSWKGL